MTQTTATILDTHIISANNAIGTVIWMHGLGADQHNFDSIVPDLCDENKLPLTFIFPNAPVRPVTINNHQHTRAWYDIFSLTDLEKEDEHGLALSQKHINQLIHNEIQRGVPANKIVLAGYSQGGAMALYTGIRFNQSLAGILALSCYLPLFQMHQKVMADENINTPIFMAHGTHDDVLPCFAGKMAYDVIQHTHPNTRWHEYTMTHEICAKEVRDIRHWLTDIFTGECCASSHTGS